MVEISKLKLWKVYQDSTGKPLRILYDNEKVDLVEIGERVFLGVHWLTNLPAAAYKGYLPLDEIYEREAGV